MVDGEKVSDDAAVAHPDYVDALHAELRKQRGGVLSHLRIAELARGRSAVRPWPICSGAMTRCSFASAGSVFDLKDAADPAVQEQDGLPWPWTS